MVFSEAILPEGFRLKSASGTLTVTWRGPTHWVFVAIGALGMAVSGVLLAGVLLSSQGLSGSSLLFGAGLLFSAYLLTLGLCNHTQIRICEERLKASHGPLPCLFPRIFHVSCRKGISIQEIGELRVEPEGQADPMTGRLPTYALHLAMRDGAVETLLTRMELDDARPLGRMLAEETGLPAVLPEKEEPKACVYRPRRP